MSQKEHITIRLTPQQFCKNCEGVVYSRFCSECGQRHIEGQLTMKFVIDQILNKILQVDSKIFKTLVKIHKPGVIAREYISGKRARYLKPFNLFIVALALYIFFSHLVSGDDSIELYYTPDLMSSYLQAWAWISNQTRFLTITTLPFIAYYTFKSFSHKGHTYVENLVIWLYIEGFSYLILAFVYLLFYFFNLSGGMNGTFDEMIYEFNFFILEVSLTGVYLMIGLFQAMEGQRFKDFLQILWTVVIIANFIAICESILIAFGLAVIDYYYLMPHLAG